MYVARTKREHITLILDNQADVETYNEILNDPSVKIIERKIVKKSESSFEEDMQVEIEQTILYLEIERCSL